MLYLWTALFALGSWWLSTLLLLKRVQLPDSSNRQTLLVVSAVLLFGVLLIGISLQLESALGACIGFGGALAVWCWHEAVYLLGMLTGPRPLPCPPHARLADRFRFGIKTSLYHELAVLLTVAVVWLWSFGEPNAVGAKALTMLWLLRWSTKINIFFGVINLHTEFWPDRLRYLETYVGDRPNRWAMLGSLALIMLLGAWALLPVLQDGGSNAMHQTAAAMLLMMLVGLGALEHVLLGLRVRDEWLWTLAGPPASSPKPVSVRAALLRDGKRPDIQGKSSGGR